MPPILSLRDVSKEFVSRGRRVRAVDRVSFDVQPGEFVTIVGPSGCGKSTILNMVVGLAAPSVGEILFRGRPKRGISTEIGYVTQQDNLLPWRTLLENVEVALEIQRVPRPDRRERARALIEQVGLSGFEQHYPHELSGGMRQRVNIIRTLIYDPEVILMDEPFGPLDALTRVSLQALLLRLWEQTRKTVVFITHDLTEAISLADRVLVMSARPGRIKQDYPVTIPRPRDVFHMLDVPEFKAAYDRLWRDLQPEVEAIA